MLQTRRLRTVAPLLLAVLVTLIPTTAGAQVPTLSLLTYDGYIDLEIVKDFEREYGVKVRMRYFNSNLERDQILRSSGSETFDLAVFTGDEAVIRARTDLLGTIDPDKAPNLAHIDPRWATTYPGVGEHCAAYFWGASGIAYRADKVSAPPATWAELLDPPRAWRGHIAMVGDGRELLGIGLKSLGESNNTSDRAALLAAGERLISQKPAVRQYEPIGTGPDSEIIAGDIWLAFVYNGDAAALQEIDRNVQFVYPSEGVVLWVDYMCLMAKSTRPTLAMKFLSFINRPDIAARNASAMYYATPNAVALALMPPDYRESDFVFPPVSVLEKSEFTQLIPARALKLVNEIQSLVLKP